MLCCVGLNGWNMVDTELCLFERSAVIRLGEKLTQILYSEAINLFLSPKLSPQTNTNSEEAKPDSDMSDGPPQVRPPQLGRTVQTQRTRMAHTLDHQLAQML